MPADVFAASCGRLRNQVVFPPSSTVVGKDLLSVVDMMTVQVSSTTLFHAARIINNQTFLVLKPGNNGQNQIKIVADFCRNGVKFPVVTDCFITASD